jgi:hypothetical protein
VDVTTRAGTQFTCFTGTRVQILTPEELRAPHKAPLPGLHLVTAEVLHPELLIHFPYIIGTLTTVQSTL